MTRFSLGVTLGAAVVTLMLCPAVNAQSCVGHSQVSGAYAFVGSRFGITNVSTSTGGSNGTGTVSSTTPVVSSTPLGQLLGDLESPSPFAVVGRVVADGAGNLFAGPNATTTITQVGTYSVNSDCTISVTLTDVFLGMPITPPGTSSGSTIGVKTSSTGGTQSTTTATPVSMTFEGIVLANGAEIDLTQTGTADTGAVITMRRALQFSGCTDASLSGTFGFVSQANVAVQGTAGGTASSFMPVSTIGRLVADGSGMFVTDQRASQSPLPILQLTGTYTVNADCTGTAQIVDSTGKVRNVAFVIVQGESTPSLTGPLTVRPELLFTYSDQNISGFGTAE
jgi:hypothetical protein